MVARDGFEPPTPAFSGPRSTPELPGRQEISLAKPCGFRLIAHNDFRSPPLRLSFGYAYADLRSKTGPDLRVRVCKFDDY